MSHALTHDSSVSLSVPQEPSHYNQIHTGHHYPGTAIDGYASAQFGDVIHQYYGQHHTPLPPSILIPFRRDRDSVERDALNDIYRLAAVPVARVALIGLGGVGKTQIAIEYAYRRRGADPQLWAFWVHASSSVRFEESYRQIAQQVRINNWADPKTEILSMVHVWLSDESNGRWAMVVDNADSNEVVFGLSSDEVQNASSRGMSAYLPSSANGLIVITSRCRDVAEGLIEYAKDIIDLGPMVEEDATVLLSKKLRKSQQGLDRDHPVRLVRELDFMPLAVTQAAAYINQLCCRMTVPQCIDRLARSDQDREALLQRDIRDPRRDSQASNSIIITWHTSFEHLRQNRMSAARLLALMSLFDREGIPENLLQDRYLVDSGEFVGEGQQIETRSQDDFNEDITMLKACSLISCGVSESLFDMHRLVQLSTRKWLEAYGELTYWQDKYIGIIAAEFPPADPSNWPVCQALLPHVEAMMSCGVASKKSLLERAVVFHRGAWYAYMTGQYRTAEALARMGLHDREVLLGHDEVPTLNSMDTLGLASRNQGRYEEAENMHRHTLVGFGEKLGAHNKFALDSTLRLAKVSRAQNKYGEAEQVCWQAMEGCKADFGLDHPQTWLSMQGLALALQCQGKFSQAESICRSILTSTKK